MPPRRNASRIAYDLGARRVEDVARAARGVERNEEQRSAVVDAVVADADEIAADDRDGALDRVEADEVRPARQRPLQRNVRTLRHLQNRTAYVHCVSKKDTKLLPITSPNVNRFSKFFPWQTHW